MNQFHFLRPDWFWLLFPLLALFAWLWRAQLRSRSWQAVCDPQLLPYLLLGRSQRRRNWPLYLVLSALLLAITALAGPVWERQPQPLFRQQSALVVLFDLSLSMHATDLKPNRLVRARLKIADILRQRREGQTALVVFAGEAFTVTPLTDDSKTIAALLDSLEPGLMPVFGSRPELAIERGRQLLQQAGLAKGELLLVTDEDQPANVMAAAEELRRSGYRLSVLGIGTQAGAPIPLSDGGFFKDSAGQLVLPQLKPAALRRLAQAGGGVYRTIQVDERDIEQLLAQPLGEKLAGQRQQSDQLGDRWREAGVWLLWPLVLLAACAFRRGWLLFVILGSLLPSPAQALDWQQLWQRADQQGAQAFEQADYADAADRFSDPRWQASARYRNGQYAEAAELLQSPESGDDYYNLANALAKTGQLPEALSAYDEALKLNPADADAQTNRKLVEEVLKQQQQEQEKSSQNGEKSPSDDSNSQNNDAEQQPSPGQSEQQAEPSDGESQSSESAAADQSRGEEKSAEQTPAKAEQAGAGEDDSATQESTAEAAQQSDEPPSSEEQRASQQWLQRIPDDPGGLLRRKFLYQYRQREQRQESGKQW